MSRKAHQQAIAIQNALNYFRKQSFLDCGKHFLYICTPKIFLLEKHEPYLLDRLFGP